MRRFRCWWISGPNGAAPAASSPLSSRKARSSTRERSKSRRWTSTRTSGSRRNIPSGASPVSTSSRAARSSSRSSAPSRSTRSSRCSTGCCRRYSAGPARAARRGRVSDRGFAADRAAGADRAVVLARLRPKVSGTNGLGDREDAVPGPLQFFLRAGGSARGAAQDVLELEPLRRPPGPHLVGEGVDRELQILARARVGLFLLVQLAGLVVRDHDAVRPFVHAVHPPRYDDVPELEAKRALNLGGRGLAQDFALEKRAKRLHPLIESPAGMIFRPVAFVPPVAPEHLEHLLECGALLEPVSLERERHGLMDRVPEVHAMVPGQDRVDREHVDEVVLERTGVVVRDAVVAE